MFGVLFMDVLYYVQFNVGDLEFGFDLNGYAKGMIGLVNYWYVNDIVVSL